jgi:hypothetical protein
MRYDVAKIIGFVCHKAANIPTQNIIVTERGFTKSLKLTLV